MTRWKVLLGGCLSLGLSACSTPIGDAPNKTRADAGDLHEPAAWHTVFADLNSLVLAGWAPNGDDAFFVGAEAQVLRYRQAQWYQFEMPTAATLWWVWGSSATNVYAGGEHGTLLHFDGSAWSPVALQLAATQTIWGIWGASSDDIWIVGGNARSNGPGFVLRGNGRHFTEQDFGDPLPNLFKVWGTSTEDVYVVGDRGLVMHIAGEQVDFQYLDPDGDGGRVESLFTVAGNAAGEVVTVGGVSAGMLFEKHGTRWRAQDPHTLGLNGVAVASSGEAYAVGLEGAIRHRVANQWLNEDHAVGRHYHSAVLMDEVVFAVGGDLLSPPADRRGLIAAKGDVASGDIQWIARADAAHDADALHPGHDPPLRDAAVVDSGDLSPPSHHDAGRRDAGAVEAGASAPHGSDASVPRGGAAELCAAQLQCDAPAECWLIQGEQEDRCVTPCSSAAECPAVYGPNPQCAPPGCQTLYTVCMPAGWRGCF